MCDKYASSVAFISELQISQIVNYILCSGIALCVFTEISQTDHFQ